MFIQTRCLYIINQEKNQSQGVYSALETRGLLSKYFSSADDENILSFLSLLPDQTVFSKSITYRTQDIPAYYISLPFFSSHFKTPVKVGEYIWVYPYTTNKNKNIYNVDSYWLSRVHGLSISEDVNYTFNDRDESYSLEFLNFKQSSEKYQNNIKGARRKKEQNKRLEEIKDTMLKPFTDFGRLTFELDSDEVSNVSSSVFNTVKKCVPRVTKMSDDLVIQGSNNTLIRLTSDNVNNDYYSKALDSDNGGEVVISTGTSKFVDNSYRPIQGNFIDNDGTIVEYDNFQLLVPENNKLPYKLIHNDFEENLKHPEIYLNRFVVEGNISEGASNILEDASRISVNENYSFDKTINRNYSDYLNLNTFQIQPVEKEYLSSLLDIEGRKEKKFKIKNFDRENSNIFNNQNIPSISLVSSNITLMSRESEGDLTFLKEYRSSLTNNTQNAYFRINSLGDAFIDANRIFIGSSNLEREKSGLLNGQGTVIRLGESDEMHSLVLGEQLKEYLNEMIAVHREDMDLTKKLFEKVHETNNDMSKVLIEKFNNALNNFSRQLSGSQSSIPAPLIPLAPGALPGAAVATAISGVLSLFLTLQTELLGAILEIQNSHNSSLKSLSDSIIAAKLKKDEEISKRIEAISTNIDKILSKISKTS